ncbi:thiol:disulfide interchange protein [Chitinophaga sp. W3I9]|uniref:hypothetical protein n=1 Tax=unclassified Chitinophaga TaxID=2619133 RepID=UPI0035233FE7
MNKFFKDVLLFTLIPLGIFLLMCVAGDEGIIAAGLIAMFLVGGYFIIGLILIIANKNHIGKVLLLSSGIILLVGLSTCGIILSGLSIR